MALKCVSQIMLSLCLRRISFRVKVKSSCGLTLVHRSDLVYDFFPFCYEHTGWASSCLRAFVFTRSSFCAWNTIPTSVHIILMIFKF